MDLVSVIVPMYNSEKTILETLNSIRNQTYMNFEVLIVDDQSTDESYEIVSEYIKSDNRFLLYKLEEKGGAAGARNLALRMARGKYIAFLDADDLWLKDKLEKQVDYMVKNNYKFTYTYYNEFVENPANLITLRKAPVKMTFNRHLFGSNNMGCLTVMYDAESIGLIQIPYLKKRNDAALWQRALKVCKVGYLLPETLSLYRRDPNSLSRKEGKLALLKDHYLMYKLNMGFGPLKSLMYTIFNILNFLHVRMFYIDKL